MIDNAAQSRFEITENGLAAFANYRQHGTRYILTHVEADPALRGTGAAGRLMDTIAAHARANHLTIVPRCPYAVAWFQRHPEASDVLDQTYSD